MRYIVFIVSCLLNAMGKATRERRRRLCGLSAGSAYATVQVAGIFRALAHSSAMYARDMRAVMSARGSGLR